MRIDRGHRRWARFSVLLLLACAAWYGIGTSGRPGAASGGTFQGLTFGIVGTLFVLFAAFLGLRRKRPHWRLGRAATWLKGHLWLGGLSLPLILFHGGFEFGGALTQVLMWLFVLVFATGVYGLALQQFLPRLMTRNIQQETVYEQIDHVRLQLLGEAQQLVEGGGNRSGAVGKAKSGGAIQGRVVQSRVALEEQTGDERLPLVQFVGRYVRPFCDLDGARTSALFDALTRAALFNELRSVIEPDLHSVADDLEAICEQRAELEHQRRLHHWLHGWLLVHAPLAWAMVVLTVIHAVMALYY